MKNLFLLTIGILIMGFLSFSAPVFATSGNCGTCQLDEECVNLAAGGKEEKWECVKTLKSGTFNVNNILDLDERDSDILILPDGTEGPAEVPGGQSQKYFTDNGRSPIVNLIIQVIEFATRVIGSLAIILLIVAGIMFMVSQGNQQRIDSAKEIFKYVIIGLIVTFMSYTIGIFVQSIFLPQNQETPATTETGTGTGSGAPSNAPED